MFIFLTLFITSTPVYGSFMLVSSIIVSFFMCERHRLLFWLARTHLCKKIYVIAWQYVYNILILQHNSKGRNSLSDKLQQPTLATHCSNISCVLEKLCGNCCLSNRILSLQQVAQNQVRLNWCFTRSNLSLQCVLQLFVATYRLTCTHRVICHCDLLQHMSPSVFPP